MYLKCSQSFGTLKPFVKRQFSRMGRPGYLPVAAAKTAAVHSKTHPVAVPEKNPPR
jgi:hypothetical protein